MKPLSFLDMFYTVLFHPSQAYDDVLTERESATPYLMYGLFAIIFVSALSPVILLSSKGGALESLVTAVPIQAVIGVLIWLYMALLVSGLGYAFTGQGHLKNFLTLSAYASMPWLLLGPLILLKTGLGVFGAFMGTVAELCVWLWTVILFALAIGMTYRMSTDRVLIVLLLPFGFAVVTIAWLIGFIQNINLLMP